MAFDTTTLDAPFAALAGFDWGADAAPLAAIDAAVVAAHGDAGLAGELEKRLDGIVSGQASRAAKEYACRKLALLGTAASVPALAARLSDADDSHMARFALERIPAPEAAAALRQALGTVRGDLVIGMISSLANRRDEASVAPLADLVRGDSASVAMAAAAALGRIATPAAASALASAAAKPGPVAAAVIDARLACADALAASGERAAAKAIYEAIAAEVGDAPRNHRDRAVRIAARSGILACLDDTVSP